MKWKLTLVWYKVFQFFFCLAMYLLPWRQPERLQGAGAVLRLPQWILERGVRKILVITDPNLLQLRLPEPFFAACKEAGLSYSVYGDVHPNPSIENIEAARAQYLAEGCEALVAFGGGSSIDCAKACGARIARPNKSVPRMRGQLRVLRRLPLLIAVPTTAGTGSETTLAAVITDTATHHKYPINDPALFPRCAVLDPLLTAGLPPSITATTGMDALTHAVEAYTNRHAPKYTDRFAEEAVRLIFQNLETAYRDGTNLDARQNMLEASYLAGAAFTRACVGNVHAIAHTLGGLYGTPHGLANAVILPYVLEDFGDAIYPKLARLAEIVGLPGANDAEKAKAFIQEIWRMNREMGVPQHITCIEDTDVPQMIAWAMAEANPVYPVPVIWGKAQFARTIARIRGGNA
ncbi:MAG: iron-containing alcohol dehydrogenase [Clostridia bacterium]|nr:iron-containing alcohol dehydrogenase [Clostridia bacterium]